jgi:hypothetical protein
MAADDKVILPADADEGERIDDNLFVVRDGPKGRGLFASCAIGPQTLIHVAPCILVSQEEYDNHMRYTIFEHYLFNAPSGNKLLALGYGSLFNHSSSRPNVDYRVSNNESIRFHSGHQPILQGEELCISYGSKLWFEDADGSAEEDSSDDDDDATTLLARIQID